MNHNMKLHPGPFEMIKSGQKTFELRLNDEKRQTITPGDTIAFMNTKTGEVLTASVIALHRFDSFADLYQTLPLKKCGYTSQDVAAASPHDMEAYYSPQLQAKYGVLGIELSPNV